ncbi:MAG: cytochrome c3 family protein [Myxococcales bacterium]|nr:cytochrome c3 family protein [Myxococcales bacterium]
MLRWALGLGLAALAGAVTAQPQRTAPQPRVRVPSYAIYPTQALPLRFDHRRHLAMPGVRCESCHTNASGSTSVSDRLTPPEASCRPCHAIDRRQPEKAVAAGQGVARCDGCHEGFDPRQPLRIARVDIGPSNLHFSHAAHVSQGQRCVDCHANVVNVGMATRLELPTMEQCVRCHTLQTPRGRCALCHLTEPTGQLITRFAEASMNPPETLLPALHHDADFWFNHRAAAARDAARCTVCHRDEQCTECHDGRMRDRRTHPNDYLTQHPAEARLAADRCTSCHRTASFCVACHDRAGVGAGASPAGRTSERIHPPPEVWSARVVGPRHHGVEARRAMTQCVSCHSERDCVTCHATLPRGGGGFNPHGPGFAARCGAMLRANERPCAQCHDDIESLRLRCP